MEVGEEPTRKELLMTMVEALEIRRRTIDLEIFLKTLC